MEIGLVKKISIDDEMQAAYLSYAMSVIVARALPDARDGLKPVHRRILYAMHDIRVRPGTPYKKSARIVGEVLGKYHPHGDSAVYDAMARMAQDFSMRYLLVDGQGNFGSIDGDAPAAMRYTEARLHAISDPLLADLEKNTVDFAGNFDDTLTEPLVLPAAIPNLLINGGTGIAVGMSTSVPPHNLNEVVDALCFMLERWDKLASVQVEDLMRFIKGPDFPTGGIIITNNKEEGLAAAYGSGRGKLLVRAKSHVEEMGRGRSRLIVTELPYQVNKSGLIERIAEAVREGRLEGISDLRDESDRQGMRIVIELSKTADAEHVLQQLYRTTQLQTTFSIIMLALVGGEPRMLSLKQALRVFLDHRVEVVRRRTEFDLLRARERAHIVEGLLTALRHLDEIIKIIRNSNDGDDARQRIMKRFRLSELQASAILDMPLRRLAKLEVKKLQDEFKQLQALIKQLEALLAAPRKMRALIIDELQQVKSIYGDRRRTDIVSAQGARKSGSTAELVAAENVWVVVTRDGKIARLQGARRPGLGRATPLLVVRASTRDTLFLITAQGRAAALQVQTVPVAEEVGQGVPWSSVCALEAGARVVGGVAFPAAARTGNGSLLLAARSGMLKKIALADLPVPAAQTARVMTVGEGDQLIGARLAQPDSEIVLATAAGLAIRFRSEQVRAMGMAAAGVQGIKLGGAHDRVVGMDVARARGEVLLVTASGEGKRIAVDDLPLQGRNGKGVTALKLAAGGLLAGAVVGMADDDVAVVTASGKAKVVKLDKLPRRTRAARTIALGLFGDKEQVAQLVHFYEAPTLASAATPAAAPRTAKQPPLKAPAGQRQLWPDKRGAKAASKSSGAKPTPAAKKKNARKRSAKK